MVAFRRKIGNFRRRGGRFRRKGTFRRRPRVIGNRVRSTDRRFHKSRVSKSFAKSDHTATWTTRTDTVIKAALSNIDAPANFSNYDPVNFTVDIPYPKNYSTLYKQWKLHKIVTYVRMRAKEGPVMHNATLNSTITAGAYIGADAAVTPVDWQVYYMATKQPDTVYNADTILLSPNRVMLSSRQHKFVTYPMVTWDKEFKSLSGTTETLPKATPSGYVDFSTATTPPTINYKIAQVLNCSQFFSRNGQDSDVQAFVPSCIVETYTTFVYKFRWRKALAIQDPSGGNDPMPPATNALRFVFDPDVPGSHSSVFTSDIPPGG